MATPTTPSPAPNGNACVHFEVDLDKEVLTVPESLNSNQVVDELTKLRKEVEELRQIVRANSIHKSESGVSLVSANQTQVI